MFPSFLDSCFQVSGFWPSSLPVLTCSRAFHVCCGCLPCGLDSPGRLLCALPRVWLLWGLCLFSGPPCPVPICCMVPVGCVFAFSWAFVCLWGLALPSSLGFVLSFPLVVVFHWRWGFFSCRLSACVRWFLCLAFWYFCLAVRFLLCNSVFLALCGFLGVQALSGWIGCSLSPKSFRPDIACACRFGWVSYYQGISPQQ